MKSPAARMIAGALALTMFVSACSDDDGDDTSTDATEQTTTTADDMAEDETTTAADDEAGADIVDTAVENGSFTTLVAAIQAAELEETLRGDGPYTVFAPTDDAFAALPAGTVDTLLEDPSGDLTDILTYHVVEGEVMAADVAGLDGQEVTTLNGATFTVNVGDDGSVTLTDGTGNEVTVVQTDTETSNGVIHVIDGVLLPG